jgi:hypothetical protein
MATNLPMNNRNPAENDGCDEFITTCRAVLRYNQGNDRGKTKSDRLAGSIYSQSILCSPLHKLNPSICYKRTAGKSRSETCAASAQANEMFVVKLNCILFQTLTNRMAAQEKLIRWQ